MHRNEAETVREQTWLPLVFTIAARPCSVTPMNACGFEAERIASTATVICGHQVCNVRFQFNVTSPHSHASQSPGGVKQSV